MDRQMLEKCSTDLSQLFNLRDRELVEEMPTHALDMDRRHLTHSCQSCIRQDRYL